MELFEELHAELDRVLREIAMSVARGRGDSLADAPSLEDFEAAAEAINRWESVGRDTKQLSSVPVTPISALLVRYHELTDELRQLEGSEEDDDESD